VYLTRRPVPSKEKLLASGGVFLLPLPLVDNLLHIITAHFVRIEIEAREWTLQHAPSTKQPAEAGMS
jgi:hypothetical protein